MATRTNQPLVVICGPTASGKSSLAMDIAQRFDGEIISADSRAIYKQMDIATAKASAAEQALVRHWGIDVVDPGQQYSAAQFKDYADRAVADIRSRSKLPILVGGTGLYVDSVVFDFEFGGEPDPELRSRLSRLDLDELRQYCIDNNIQLPTNNDNRRHIIRAIETESMSVKSSQRPIDNCIVVAIATDRQVLRQRIVVRIEQMFDNGVVDEAIKLGKIYGWDSESMTGNIYRLARQYAEQQISRQQFIDKSITQDYRLAKRQMTWLRRNPHLLWGGLNDVNKYLTDYLSDV